MENNFITLISGDYNHFRIHGWNSAGVYMASGIIKSDTIDIPIYIGSSECLKNRIVDDHIQEIKNEIFTGITNKILFNYSLKYGLENVIWFLIEECPKDQTLIREQYYLDLYQPFIDMGRGFNISRNVSAPMKGNKHSLETIEKMQRSQKRRFLNSPGTNKGKIFSKEIRRNMSLGQKKRAILFPDEKKGRIVSLETRRRQSKLMKERGLWKGDNNPNRMNPKRGKDSPNFGKKVSEEDKIKFTKRIDEWKAIHGHPREKKVICIETRIIYDSAKEAYKSTSLKCDKVSGVCNGRRKSAAGLHWRWLEDYQKENNITPNTT